MDGLERKSRGVGETDQVVVFLDVYGLFKAICRLVTEIWNRSQPDHCRVSCNEEELETVEHLLSNCPVLGKLRNLGRGFFDGFNSVSRADMKALHRFISNFSWFNRFLPFCFVWSV